MSSDECGYGPGVFREVTAAKGGSRARMMRRKVFAIALVVLLIFTGACTSNNAQALFESAQLEERQNNPVHAKELYQEILTKYPKSEYASKAEGRLRELQRK